MSRPTVSLGSHCYAAWLLDRIGVATPPMPFDWLSSDADMVADCLEDDFRTLLDPGQYTFVKPGKTVTQRGLAAYSGRYKRPVVFSHSDPTTPAGHRYLETCVERLRDLFEDHASALFLIVARPERTAAAKLDRLERVLAARMADPLLLTVVQCNHDNAAPSAAVTLREQTAHRVTYELVATSEMKNGLSFRNVADNDAIATLVLKHRAAA